MCIKIFYLRIIKIRRVIGMNERDIKELLLINSVDDVISILSDDLKDRYAKCEQPMIDMFPQTDHVESIILMTNSGQKGK